MKRITAKFDAHILVVEDYLLNAEVIKEILEIMGCVVDVADSGMAALELLKERDYNVIFMDIQMPVMDGLATTREIKKLPGKKAQIPIVALTANALRGDREKYLAEGMDDFVSKPLTSSDLERVLVKFVTGNKIS
ncbi:response regulator [Estrella lausannensis]|uniref:Two-component system, response regulator n=1 Tax=Estrella lausannensis TaxID=483423 RepID=A0A0H5DQR9_9BACT|nr:response regulator [Estrella lausannensis]CRX38892.1 two-component system, response regulator [Estrella lausannensis]